MTVRRAAIGLALLVALAGCAGSGGGPSPAATTGETAAGGPTPAGTASTTPDPARSSTPTTAAPAGATPENTVRYAELNDRQRAAFRGAVNGSSRFLPITEYTNAGDAYDYRLADPFTANEFVVYEGDYYRIETEDGRYYTSYLVDTYRAPYTDPENLSEDEVIAFERIPAGERDEVRRAIEEGRYTVPYGEEWSPVVSEFEYVQFDGQLYAIEVDLREVLSTVLTARRVGGSNGSARVPAPGRPRHSASR